MVRGKHASGSSARIKKLSVIGFAQADSAAGEKAQLPGTFLDRILSRGLRGNCRTRKKQQDENTKNLHALPHALPPVSRSPETHSASKYAAEIPASQVLNPAETKASSVCGQGASVQTLSFRKNEGFYP
jgi:hypothetical protein